MRIVQLSSADVGGGAERVAMLLHDAFRRAGHDALLVVGHRRHDHPGVIEIAPQGRIETIADAGARTIRGGLGFQGIGYLSTRHIEEAVGGRWDAAIVHNLHGDYVSVGVVRRLLTVGPVVVAMHDMWLLTGHCAHSFGCTRWQTGCGSCPALGIYPAIRRDATRTNLALKRRTLDHPGLTVVSSASWLLDLAQSTYLAQAPMTRISNPVDTSVFRPGSRAAARGALGLTTERPVIFFPGALNSANPFKDPSTVLQAVSSISDLDPVLLAFGPVDLPHPGVDVQVAAETDDPATIALRYVAADVVAHLARAETSPLAITEAMACGTAVVATDVGGIAELLGSGESGLLSAPGDAHEAAANLRRVLTDSDCRNRLCESGLERVRRHHHVDAVAARWVELLGSVSLGPIAAPVKHGGPG